MISRSFVIRLVSTRNWKTDKNIMINALNILIVDDDRNLARTLADGLRKQLGKLIHVDVCFSGADAFVACTKRKFDLIISDHNMPGMTGLDLFKRIHNLSQRPTLVLITAYGSSELEEETVHFADAYITKPFELAVLSQFIKQLVVTEETEGSYRVLILEDDPYMRRLISKVLKNANYDVTEASTLKEAKKALDESRFDVFLADIQVTDGYGTDLIREYREMLAENETVIILATGESRYHHLESELNIDMYLEKPIAIQDLVTIIKRWTSEKEKRL